MSDIVSCFHCGSDLEIYDRKNTVVLATFKPNDKEPDKEPLLCNANLYHHECFIEIAGLEHLPRQFSPEDFEEITKRKEVIKSRLSRWIRFKKAMSNYMTCRKTIRKRI